MYGMQDAGGTSERSAVHRLLWGTRPLKRELRETNRPAAAAMERKRTHRRCVSLLHRGASSDHYVRSAECRADSPQAWY